MRRREATLEMLAPNTDGMIGPGRKLARDGITDLTGMSTDEKTGSNLGNVAPNTDGMIGPGRKLARDGITDPSEPDGVWTSWTLTKQPIKLYNYRYNKLPSNPAG
jgi:hypothetical protein